MRDPIKVSSVREWKVPTNTTENHAFQGFANFYRHFISNFLKIARPLNDLLKTGVKWHWGEEQQKVFEEIKKLIMSEPVLHQPDQTKPFKVKADVSNYAVGVMIDLLLLVASHWVSQGEFLKTTDHSEEGKNTEGQYNDQDL